MTRFTLMLSLILTAVALLSLAAARAWPFAVDVGDRDARFVTGFHEPETSDAGARYRWSDGDSTIALPRPPLGSAAILSLRLFDGRPAGQTPPTVAVTLDGAPLVAFALPDKQFRTYRLLVRPAQTSGWAARVGVGGDTIQLPNDPRPLGVVVTRAALDPLGPPLPSLWLLICAVLIGLLAAALPQLAGLGERSVVAFAAVVLLLVAAVLAIRPLDVLPFVQRFVALLAIGCLGLGVVRLLGVTRGADLDSDAKTQRREGRSGDRELSGTRRDWRRLADRLPGEPQNQRVVSGQDLPILLAIAWWLPVCFQLFQRWDGASIGLGDETLWIGGALCLALLLLMIWRVARRGARIDRRALLGAVSLAALAHLIYGLVYAFTRTGKDFWILFKGTREWVRGGSLYDLTAVLTNHVGAVFKVPPFYAMLFAPFVFRDGLEVLFYHRLMNLGLMIATVIIFVRMFEIRPRWWALALAPILLNSRPLADTVAFGQIDLMLLFLMTCALWALRSGRDTAAGVFIALGAMFKIYPVILLAFLLIKRRWRGFAGFAIGMIVANGLALLTIGWEMHRVYLFEVLPNIGGTTSWVENQTISGVIARLADVPFDAHLFENRALSLLGTALSALVSAIVCLLSLRPSEPRSTTFALQFCMYLLLMVFAVPAAWMHYETLLLLPFGVLLVHLREREIPLWRAALLALSFGLVCYGNQWSFNGTAVMGVLTIAGVSYKFYGMLLLYGLMAGEILAGWQPSWRDLRAALPWVAPVQRAALPRR